MTTAPDLDPVLDAPCAWEAVAPEFADFVCVRHGCKMSAADRARHLALYCDHVGRESMWPKNPPSEPMHVGTFSTDNRGAVTADGWTRDDGATGIAEGWLNRNSGWEAWPLGAEGRMHCPGCVDSVSWSGNNLTPIVAETLAFAERAGITAVMTLDFLRERLEGR